MARALALLALVLALPATASAASISGTVFNDYDADGVRAEPEPPLGGVTVTLGGISAVSADDGSWSFDGVEPGTHRITWTPPDGGVCTTIGCAVDVEAGATGVLLGVQLGGILIDEGGASQIGKVRLIAPRGGCRVKPFSARIEGNGVTGVKWRLDGRRLTRGRRARVPVRRLARGRHLLVAEVAFGSGRDAPVKRLSLRFRRCRYPRPL